MRTLILLFSAAALFAQPVDPARGLTLSNDHVKLQFEPSGMGLNSLIDVASGENHIHSVEGKHLLWQLMLGRGTLSETMDNNRKPCTYARIETLTGGVRRAVMEWNDLRWWLEDNAVSVRVTVDLAPDSGIALWRIFVENHSDYWGLASVAFPAVNGAPAAGAYDIARPVFAAGGQLLPKWTEPVRGRHPSGGWPMQFFSLQQPRGSLYVGTRDPDGRAKDFVVEPGSRISVIHYPENLSEAGSNWPDFYPVEFGVFRGSWVEAARHYREWALRQKWASAGRLSGRRVPAMAKNAAFWVNESWLWDDPPKAAAHSTNMAEWVQDRSSAGVGEADPHKLNARLLAAQDRMGVQTALHWYNWHETVFDNQYPHFLPAKKGFAERVKELTARGILVMPYINGSSADMNIPDWSKFAPYAIADEAGGFRQHLYSEAAGRLLSMCPSQSFWQGTIAALVERLVGELGVNAVYVDQISAMEHEMCFQRTHGHPLGGGHYWVDGNRELLRRVRNVADRAGREITITSEGADEMFLDLVDENLTWAQPSDFEIPLMQVVYSGYTLFFGSPCDYEQSDRFFRYAQGQALIDGRQNGWMNLRLFDPKHERKVQYLSDCARTRTKYLKYLSYGELVEPVTPLDPVPVFTEEVFGWDHKHRGTVPAAEGRLWKAEDGSLALFFANYGDERVRFRYRTAMTERTEVLEPASVKVVELPR
jgi:Domain of unknown function (DUF6259)